MGVVLFLPPSERLAVRRQPIDFFKAATMFDALSKTALGVARCLNGLLASSYAIYGLCGIFVGIASVLDVEKANGHSATSQARDARSTTPIAAQEFIATAALPRRLADSSFFSLAFSSEHARAEYLLKAFRQAFRGTGEDGRIVLDVVQVVGLAPTAKNAQAVREALSETNNVSERAALIRLLGSLYPQIDDAVERRTILNDLRQLCANEVPEVRRSAVLAYSRLGFFFGFPGAARECPGGGKHWTR